VQICDFITPEFVKVITTIFDVFNVSLGADESEDIFELCELCFGEPESVRIEVFEEFAVVEAFLGITILLSQQGDVCWVRALVLENVRYFFS